MSSGQTISWSMPCRTKKPRELGITHAGDKAMGLRAVEDLCESVGEYLDVMKIRGWPFQDWDFVCKKNQIYSQFDVITSSGDYLEYVILQGFDKVQDYISEAKDLGFTAIEVSDAIVIMPFKDKMKVVESAAKADFKVIRETGKKDLDWNNHVFNVKTYLTDIRGSLEAGAWKVMIESQGLSEFQDEINKDFYHEIVNEIGMESLILEAPNEKAYSWFITEFGPDANICTGSADIFEAEHYRRGLRGRRSVFGLMQSF